MKKAGIVIDRYKKRTFVRALKRNNFDFEEPIGFTAGTLIIRVHYEEKRFDELQRLVRKMDIDAKLSN